MSENMICPNCSHFQPKAEECAKCGVVIAKAQQAGTPPPKPVEPAAASSSSGLPLPAIVLGVAVLIGGGALLFSGEEESVPEPEKTPSAAVQATSGQLKQANMMIMRARTQEKLRALVTRLNMIAIQQGGMEPPSADEGLAKFVRDGVLGKEDITDAWGRVFVYELEMGPDRGMMGEEFEIRLHSVGADGVDGTADDIGM